MADKGEIFGIGVTVAGAVASIAAIARGASKRSYGPISDDLDKLSYREGNIPGYETTPGYEYDVYLWDGTQEQVVDRLPSIWFNSGSQEVKWLRDSIKDILHLPLGGTLLAIAHHMKAGRHKLGKHQSKAPMRGFNLWGMTAYKPWIQGDTPRPFWKSQLPGGGTRNWHWYETPEESIRYFYNLLSKYPTAKNELGKKAPDPYLYAWGLSSLDPAVRYSYIGGLETRAGGTYVLGRELATYMNRAARGLREEFDFTIPDYLLDIPVLSDQEIFDALCHNGADQDELIAFVLDSRKDRGTEIDVSSCPVVVP